jgi:hypothetical protein
MSKYIKSLFGTISKNPLVGLGVVGIKTLTNFFPFPALEAISPVFFPVANPIDQIPFLGYSTKTIFLDLLFPDAKFLVSCPTPL